MNQTEKQWALQAHALGLMVSKCPAHECKCSEFAKELVDATPDSIPQIDFIAEPLPEALPGEGI